MKQNHILAIDQGTTGTRAILYNSKAVEVASAYSEFKQYYPKPGWVEHDAEEIWQTTLKVINRAITTAKIKSSSIASIGITNQRETVVLWDKKSSKPIGKAIVWQDRRTAPDCESLIKRGYENLFRDKTGLVLDPYFSGTKIKWLLRHNAQAKRVLKAGRLAFGTIDSWLIWKLTGGKSHHTDYTNASRTLLFNIKTKTWDPQLLKILGIPQSILPSAIASGDLFGLTERNGKLSAGIPIYGVMGDQQAALYGQSCYKAGQSKNTYGTGCFVVSNIGKQVRKAPKGLLLTLASNEEGEPVYAFEGAIFIAGAAVQWLRDGLKFFKDAKETEKIAKSVKDSGGVSVIPAFAGLASPYWNPNVRGVIAGITRGTTEAHVVRATLESIGQRSADVVHHMNRYMKPGIRALSVDGGATKNGFLMQYQADILGMPVHVSDIAESTAWGVAKLAGHKCGLWPSLKSLHKKRNYKTYRPKMSPSERRVARTHWEKEVHHLLRSC